MEATQKSTILVVDDTDVNIAILLGILSSEYRVMAAMDGPCALEAALEKLPDLILLDIMMPGMDGYEVCQRLKADERTRGIPVIFCTALGEEEDESKGLELGAVDYIVKPVKPAIVKARVRTHLELKHKSAQLEELIRLDCLTRIPNRRGFNETMSNEWWRAARDQTSRYGGEEFAVVAPNTDLNGALLIAETIRRNVELLGIEHAQSEAAEHVTISLGVAALVPQPHDPLQQLIDLADKRLYLAKSRGRNRAVGEEPAA